MSFYGFWITGKYDYAGIDNDILLVENVMGHEDVARRWLNHKVNPKENLFIKDQRFAGYLDNDEEATDDGYDLNTGCLYDLGWVRGIFKVNKINNKLVLTAVVNVAEVCSFSALNVFSKFDEFMFDNYPQILLNNEVFYEIVTRNHKYITGNSDSFRSAATALRNRCKNIDMFGNIRVDNRVYASNIKVISQRILAYCSR